MSIAARSVERRAHTLWEVLVVLALLGALAALVAPSLRLVRQEHDELAGTTRELAALLERARRTAVERGATVELRLDPLGGRGWVFVVGRDSLELVAVPTFRRTSIVDVTGAGPRPRFVFGAAGAAAGSPLQLRASGGVRRIAVDWRTGGIDVVSR